MTLQEIVANSNYITDESLTDTNIVGLANACIATVNTELGTALPFYETANLDTAYTAINDSWQLRLLEPYFSYSLMANDDNENTRNFHYNRFLDALRAFKKNGIKDIVIENDEGEATGYAGTAIRSSVIDPSANSVLFGKW